MNATLAPLPTDTDQPVRLNIGAGDTVIDGFTPIDRKFGTEAYPLNYADGSVEEIRCSHMLEHLPFKDLLPALREWYRVLRPGGLIRIAVPDLEKIIELRQKGDPKWRFYLMGGQTDGNDFHKCVFDEEHLAAYMAEAGFGAPSRWESPNTDCAALECSLNLEARKPVQEKREVRATIRALMGLPRVGWNDAWLTITTTLNRFKIPITTHTGCFWGQNIERGFEEALSEGIDWLLTFDYDTMCTPAHLEKLLDTFARNPHIDALASFQMRRGKEYALLGVKGERRLEIGHEPIEVDSAHFGMTLLRVAALKDLPKPWLHAVPDSNGGWGPDRRDDDISFWDKWKAAGKTIYVDPTVRIGHLELVVSEYDENIQPRHVHITRWWEEQQGRGRTE